MSTYTARIVNSRTPPASISVHVECDPNEKVPDHYEWATFYASVSPTPFAKALGPTKNGVGECVPGNAAESMIQTLARQMIPAWSAHHMQGMPTPEHIGNPHEAKSNYIQGYDGKPVYSSIAFRARVDPKTFSNGVTGWSWAQDVTFPDGPLGPVLEISTTPVPRWYSCVALLDSAAAQSAPEAAQSVASSIETIESTSESVALAPEPVVSESKIASDAPILSAAGAMDVESVPTETATIVSEQPKVLAAHISSSIGMTGNTEVTHEPVAQSQPTVSAVPTISAAQFLEMQQKMQQLEARDRVMSTMSQHPVASNLRNALRCSSKEEIDALCASANLSGSLSLSEALLLCATMLRIEVACSSLEVPKTEDLAALRSMTETARCNFEKQQAALIEAQRNVASSSVPFGQPALKRSAAAAAQTQTPTEQLNAANVLSSADSFFSMARPLNF